MKLQIGDTVVELEDGPHYLYLVSDGSETRVYVDGERRQ